MKKIMVILSGGGHTEQMLKLIDMLGNKFEYIYIICEDDKISEKRIEIKGKIYKIRRPLYPTSNVEKSKFVNSFSNSLKNIKQSLSINFKERSDAIISCGPSTAVFISIIGKFFGSKIIFIESWSRVNFLSLSGRILYNFSDLFFVQWKKLQKNYPKAIFAGRLA